MPGTTATPNVLTDAGYLFVAPIGTAEPTMTVVGSKFTTSWTGGWLSLGATENGSEFDYSIKTAAITVEEFYDPIRYSTTERSGSLVFAMANYALTNVSYAMNGIGTTVPVSGSGSTLLTSFTPPTVGSETRVMLGWESLDNTVRIVMYQCINSGTVKMAFKKAPALATVACTFNFEIPTTGLPFKMYGAGTNRA